MKTSDLFIYFKRNKKNLLSYPQLPIKFAFYSQDSIQNSFLSLS
jgi:hypothetical protein